jgi:hypothetical protein
MGVKPVVTIESPTGGQIVPRPYVARGQATPRDGGTGPIVVKLYNDVTAELIGTASVPAGGGPWQVEVTGAIAGLRSGTVTPQQIAKALRAGMAQPQKAATARRSSVAAPSSSATVLTARRSGIVTPATVGGGTSATDDFERVDLGVSWATGTPPITLSAGYATVTVAGDAWARWITDTFTADQHSDIEMQAVVGGSAIAGVRIQANGDGYYVSSAEIDNGEGGSYPMAGVFRKSGASWISLGLEPSVASSPFWRIGVVGTTITVYTKATAGGAWTSRGTWTDATHATGQPGIAANGGGHILSWAGGNGGNP